jgi:hypothetical protein
VFDAGVLQLLVKAVNPTAYPSPCQPAGPGGAG